VVDYGLSTAYGSSSALNTTPVTSHSRTLSNLTPSTIYHYRVRSVDGAGNVATSLDYTFATPAAPDTTPPIISAVTAGAITFNSAEITWTTNEAGTSWVQYSTDLSLNLSSALDTTPVTSHRRLLTGLAPATVYVYRVITTDAAGNTAQSEPFTFTSTAAPDTTPPQDVRDFSATGDNRRVVLAWVNPPDTDFVGVRIRYRTDRFPVDSNDGALLGDLTGQPGQPISTTHQDLANGITYFYAASTYDGAGNRQNTVYASATPSGPVSDIGEPQNPIGGCGMIVPRDGDPPGPGKAADLLVMALAALFMIRRKCRKLGSKCFSLRKEACGSW
jgi:predicted phage tail protein